MTYNPDPPYDLLQNRLLTFQDMQRMRRFARYWDLVGNSGNFVETTPLIWPGETSPFDGFMRWADWLFAKVGRTDSIALVRLFSLLFEFLTVELGLDKAETARVMWADYQRGGRSDYPIFMRDYLPRPEKAPSKGKRIRSMKRQARHLGADE